MVDSNLGRLEPIQLRDVWTTEAGDFTPWLAREENLSLLGDTIGIELQLEAQEQEVGPFRADILCKDTATDHWVLIENQLERTDHTHLGQLMTYAAGLKAVTIVWIADRFTDEHRATLDWLNDITDDRFNFFGLEVELWRIGDSVIAPKFNMACKPNDWTKTIGIATHRMDERELTDTKRVQLDYWNAFREYVSSRGSQIKPTKAQPQNWMYMSLGRSGFVLCAIASTWNEESGTYDTGEVRAEVVINHRDGKAFFESLLRSSSQIDDEMGEALTWTYKLYVKTRKIYVRRTADIADRDDWPNQHEWLTTKLEALQRIFRPRVQELSLEATTAPSDEHEAAHP